MRLSGGAPAFHGLIAHAGRPSQGPPTEYHLFYFEQQWDRHSLRCFEHRILAFLELTGRGQRRHTSGFQGHIAVARADAQLDIP